MRKTAGFVADDEDDEATDLFAKRLLDPSPSSSADRESPSDISFLDKYGGRPPSQADFRRSFVGFSFSAWSAAKESDYSVLGSNC